MVRLMISAAALAAIASVATSVSANDYAAAPAEDLLAARDASPTERFVVKRQAASSSSTRTRTRTTTATAVASATAPAASNGANTLPASVLSILATITSGTGNPTATVPLAVTETAGARNPSISNAPPLPDANSIPPSNFPTLDVVPPTNSSQVQAWLSKIDMTKVPNIPATVNAADCASNPTNLAQAQQNAWWTCGGYTRSTDITTCPDKNTWGLSYDDGPSPYTPQLLDYLDSVNLKSTFFIVGSRAISRPAMLQTEYMSGHQLCVHTWSHPPLTTLTNEQIVAELGWTKEVIRQITGVTPNTMRPPYGDIDDRVRAISLQMGLTPIIWTSTGPNENFDTNDWRIGAGQVTAAQSVETFETILRTGPSLSTGYIVLAHDLYQQSVDLATKVILPFALGLSPKQNIEPIITCLKQPLGNAYIETNSNTTGSSPASIGSLSASATRSGASASATTSAGSGGSRSSARENVAPLLTAAGAAAAAVAAAVAVLV